MELFETQGILKPMELLKQVVFCPSEIDGTDGIIPLFFCSKRDSIGFWFHRFLKIPSIFSNISWILRKIPSALKSFLGFKKFHGFQKVPWILILCFQVKKYQEMFRGFRPTNPFEMHRFFRQTKTPCNSFLGLFIVS